MNKKKELVILDSSVLIDGLLNRTKEFFEELKKDTSKQIVLPAPVFAEVLAGGKHNDEALLEVFEKKFEIAPFDGSAAKKYAEIFSDKNKKRKETSKHEKPPRNVLKFDCMIIAIAISRNASCIYSLDKDFKTVANGLITVHNALPEPVPTPLFGR